MGAQEQAEMERLSDRAVPGLDRLEIGDWIMRSGRRATGRANSVWARGDPGVAVSSAVDAVEAWYGERGARPLFQVFDGATGAIGGELDRRGYRSGAGALVMTADIKELEMGHGLDTGSTVAASRSAGPSFASLIDNQDRLAELTSTPLEQTFVTLSSEDGTVIGGGLGTLDEEWIGVFAMSTVGEARRRGVARRVLRELIGRGRQSGAERAWLQVMPDNEPARALYQRAGFSEIHNYHYRTGGLA